MKVFRPGKITKICISVLTALALLSSGLSTEKVNAEEPGETAVSIEKQVISELQGYALYNAPESGEKCEKATVNLIDCGGTFVDDEYSGWAIKIGNDFKRVSADGKFIEGTWRYEVCLKLNETNETDGMSGKNSVFSDEVSVIISEENWNMISPAITSGNASWFTAASPEMEVKNPECAHVWQEGLSTESCGQGGVQYYVCSKCGVSKSEARPATGNHTNHYQITKDECYEACDICGFISNKSEHDFIILQRTGGCTSGVVKKACRKCGYQVTEKLDGGHTWSEEYGYDSMSHFRFCTECGAKDETTIGLHEGTGICAVCKAPMDELSSYIQKCAHGPVVITFAENGTAESQEEAAGSAPEVSEVTVKERQWLIHVEAVGSCESGVAEHYFCPACEAVFTAAEEPQKTDMAALRYEDGEHKYENECAEICHLCGETRKAGHAFSSEQKRDGAMHFYECEVCGARTRAENHELSDWIPDSEKMCGKELNRHIECEICGQIIVRDHAVVSHDYSSWTLKDATCIAEGYATRECTMCGVKQEYELPKVTHTTYLAKEETTDVATGIVIPRKFVCEVCLGEFADAEGMEVYREIEIPDIEPASQEESRAKEETQDVVVKKAPDALSLVLIILGPAMLVGGIILLVFSKKRKN